MKQYSSCLPSFHLPPFLTLCSLNKSGYCFDSANSQQDMKEGRLTHSVYRKLSFIYNLKMVLHAFDFSVCYDNYPHINFYSTQSKLKPQPQTSWNLSKNWKYSNSRVIFLPLLFSSAYLSAGCPTPSFPRQTSPAARLSLVTSPSHCVPGDSAGPLLSSVCLPGASAALPSPGGALRSHCAVLDCSAESQCQDLLLTGPFHWPTQHPL